ncbi:MAG: fused MFS/spermidine synthase [Candidatus Aminicenantes bacterium]|jgi:spermidine synthase
MSFFKKKEIIFQKQTRFNNLTVIRKRNIITLWSGGNKQTEIDASNPLCTRLEYSRNFFLSLVFHPAPGSILVLGLGGGAIPSLLHSILENSIIDVVEIDPEMPAIAKEYFYFSISERLRVFIDDAYFFIRDTHNNYDIVLLDAYIENQILETVDSMEFFAETARVLAPNGIFVANLMTLNQGHFENIIERMSRVFKDIWMLPGVTSTNSLVFAARNKILGSKIQKKAKKLIKKIPFDLKIHKLMNRLENIRQQG